MGDFAVVMVTGEKPDWCFLFRKIAFYLMHNMVYCNSDLKRM